MIRETSLTAFRTIKDSGLLSERREQVYELLFHHGPLTGSELAVIYRKHFGALAPNAGNIVTRLGEMREMGCVKECGKRVCSITNMEVILWDVTDKLPAKLEKKSSRIKTLEDDRAKLIKIASWALNHLDTLNTNKATAAHIARAKELVAQMRLKS